MKLFQEYRLVNNKAMEMAIGTVATVALVLIVLVVVAVYFTGGFSQGGEGISDILQTGKSQPELEVPHLQRQYIGCEGTNTYDCSVANCRDPSYANLDCDWKWQCTLYCHSEGLDCLPNECSTRTEANCEVIPECTAVYETVYE